VRARFGALPATLVLVLLLAGCGGAEEEPPPVGLRATPGAPAPGAAEVFERFLEAAGRGDAVSMWGLLSEPTRASLASLDRFRWSTALELRKAAGSFVEEPRLVLAQAPAPAWAVAAAAGEIERDEEREPAAFAAALRREEAGWRVELNGVFFVGHRPAPQAELEGDEPPLLGATAQSSATVERMVVWLDGEAIGSRAGRPQPFVGTIAARPAAPLEPGVHIVTVFAATGETAAAQAWPFVVEP
jgi:hypothetical protein